MAAEGKNVCLVKLGPKSLGDGCQDICKDKESNLGPAAWLLRLKLSRVKLYFSFVCETEDFVIWNFCFCSLLKGMFNVLTKVNIWHQPWNVLTVINKIVFTSPEAMVEFSGCSSKTWCSSKTLLTYVNLYLFERSRYFFP